MRLLKFLAPACAVLLVIACVVMPLIYLIMVSFWGYDDYAMTPAFSLSNYWAFLFDSAYLPKLWQTMLVAGTAAILATFLGWTGAYAVLGLRPNLQLPLLLTLSAPFLVGEVLRIISLAASLDVTSPLAQLAQRERWALPRLIYSPNGTVLGLVQTWVTIPLLLGYLGLGATLKQHSAVARTLGAGSVSIAWRVLLPLNVLPLSTSFAIVFLGGFTDWLQAMFLGGPQGSAYGGAIERQAVGIANWPMAAVMILASLVVSIMVVGVPAVLGLSLRRRHRRK